MMILIGLVAGNMATISAAAETSPELALMTVLACVVAMLVWPVADLIEAVIA